LISNPARVLPTRSGAHPVDHALTYFDHVRLPKLALLGDLAKVHNERQDFIAMIYRIAVGTLILSACVISCLKLCAFNAYRFSRNRLVTGEGDKPVAVIEFRTQNLPILHSVAQYTVLEPFLLSSAEAFRDTQINPRVRHGIATVFKAVGMGHFEKSVKAMNERCGWQGHFERNQLVQLEVSAPTRFLARKDMSY
jgi:acyl-CoA oxidase